MEKKFYLAGLVTALVWVILLGHHSLADRVCERVWHQSSVAPLVANLLGRSWEDHAVVLAVDELLLADVRQFVMGDKVLPFHVRDCGECPKIIFF